MRAKPRQARIDREDSIEIHEDENAHLWAVSYADFLMALLSFFILFFSVDTDHRQKLIMNITQELSQANGDGLHTTKDSIADGRLPAGMLDAVKILQVDVEKEKENLIVHFPDDIFRAGEHHVEAGREPLLARFLGLLKKYDGHINIYFEGHTDSSPLLVHRNEIVSDNFVLSSLRAASALRLAKEAGFSENHLFIQADSSNTRNSRSLSIRVEPLVEKL